MICFCRGAASSLAQDTTRPAASTSEADPALPAPGHSVHGEAFNDRPLNHAHLTQGQGKIHSEVITYKPESQRFIDQGNAQLHIFYYFESERSFREAARVQTPRVIRRPLPTSRARARMCLFSDGNVRFQRVSAEPFL